MMPPTSIDGTDITGATIDGQDVQEITVDGDTVFTAGIPQPPSGIAYWTFDNDDTSGSTAIDVWGSNNLTINGATTGVTGANVNYTTNEAYDFDGTNDTVEGTNLLSWSELSVNLWSNSNSFASGDNYIFHIGPSAGSYYPRIFTNSFNEFDFQYEGVRLAGPQAQIGVWTMLTLTYDGSNVEFYVDGTSFGTGTASGGHSNENVSIGNLFGFGSSYFNGQIDDVRVYDKGLSSSEVSNLYTTGSIL
jgi:hypothetical protein